MPCLEDIVGHHAWPRAARDALVGLRPELIELLVRGQSDLDDDEIRSWAPQLSVRGCESLADRPLAPETANWLAARETRAGPLAALVRRHRLESSVLARIAASRLGRSHKVAVALLCSGRLDPELAARVAERVDGLGRLIWLVRHGSDGEVRCALGRWSEWAPPAGQGRRKMWLAALFADRPHLLDAAVAAGAAEAVVIAAAGCRHLTALADQRTIARRPFEPERKFALTALVHNPVVHPEILDELAATLAASGDPWIHGDLRQQIAWRRNRLHSGDVVRVEDTFEAVSDGRQLERLVHRTVMGLRVWDIPALAANPHLSGAMRINLASALRHKTAGELFGPDRLAELLGTLDPGDGAGRDGDRGPDDRAEPDGPVDQTPTADRMSTPMRYTLAKETAAAMRARLRTATQWRVAFGLVEDFDGTCAEFLDLVEKLAEREST